MPPMDTLQKEIQHLKKDRNAIVLAHYYVDGEIQDIADGLGDSLYLAQQGQQSEADVIVLAGVVFMGESVKILSPKKMVLVPDLSAGCSLVEMTPTEAYKKWRNECPQGVAVTYINSSTEVKALSDVICTSSNALQIIESIPKDRPILFGPDKNLGRFLMKKTGREMILWPGACEVHVLFSSQKLHELHLEHPDAKIIAHPECEDAVLDQADFIGSTSALLNEVKNNPSSSFIVATEEGIFHEMKKQRPEAHLIQAPAQGHCACNECPYMKKNSLEKIRDALRDLSPQIHVEPQLMEKAHLPLKRMMAISSGHSVSYS